MRVRAHSRVHGCVRAPTHAWSSAHGRLALLNQRRACTLGDAEAEEPWIKRSTRKRPNSDEPFFTLREENSAVDVRAWVRGVPVERTAHQQLMYLASMREVIKHPVAAMPDIHFGTGTTVGTVIPTTKAIIPSSVGVDIGCGMLALKTSLQQEDLPSNLAALRLAIECAVPHGRTHNGRQENDCGGWRGEVPAEVAEQWRTNLEPRFRALLVKRPEFDRANHINHLGTLGTGNHFIEVCLDESGAVWLMLHSGSRGIGNRIGQTFIELAHKDMGALAASLPDKNLAYLREGTQHFEDYVEAVSWAQDYARASRELMAASVLRAMRRTRGIKPFTTTMAAINCHHNYVERATLRDGEQIWLTRKGATSAKLGELAIIPGSMGARSYIVRGKGNEASYCSCSHGAGRRFSRGEATRRFTMEDHENATNGVECRKDRDVLDETPLAYKDIDRVMDAQRDLVEVVATLRQVLCVKG